MLLATRRGGSREWLIGPSRVASPASCGANSCSGNEALRIELTVSTFMLISLPQDPTRKIRGQFYSNGRSCQHREQLKGACSVRYRNVGEDGLKSKACEAVCKVSRKGGDRQCQSAEFVVVRRPNNPASPKTEIAICVARRWFWQKKRRRRKNNPTTWAALPMRPLPDFANLAVAQNKMALPSTFIVIIHSPLTLTLSPEGRGNRRTASAPSPPLRGRGSG